MHFISEDTRNVMYGDGKIIVVISPHEKTETVRIDLETIADVTYLFDIEDGRYVEFTRTERPEPLPPEEH